MPDPLPERPGDAMPRTHGRLSCFLMPVPLVKPAPTAKPVLMVKAELERANTDPSLWREPVVHRALPVSGLSVLVGSLAQLEAELERSDRAL